jgi:hypothetical protein
LCIFLHFQTRSCILLHISDKIVYFASFSDNIVHFSSFSDKIVYFASYFRQDCVFCFIFRQYCVFCLIFQTKLCFLLNFQTSLCILCLSCQFQLRCWVYLLSLVYICSEWKVSKISNAYVISVYIVSPLNMWVQYNLVWSSLSMTYGRNIGSLGVLWFYPLW